MTLSPAKLQVGRVNELIARAGALIFDVDGTLAETEEVHRQAFNEAFMQAGIDWCWGRTIYKELLRLAGGKERMRAFDRMRETDGVLSEAESTHSEFRSAPSETVVTSTSPANMRAARCASSCIGPERREPPLENEHPRRKFCLCPTRAVIGAV